MSQQQMKKKSVLLDQNKLKIVCDQLCDKIEDLLDHFDLEYKHNTKFVSMSCPIHEGDNDSALNIYHTGDTYRGNWKCRTHQCDKIFKGSIIGFLRGILSRRELGWVKEGDDMYSFQDTVSFALKFLNLDMKNVKVSKYQKEKDQFVTNAKILSHNIKPNHQNITRASIRKSLLIPSPYFMSRGFSPEVLKKYDVGECQNPTKTMHNRAVVPIYNTDYEYMVGCSGRTIDDNIKPKWKHSSDFKAEENLYNFWFAQEYIKQNNEVVLVESPGNVWKLEENGIHNSVATFGAHLTDKQKMLLDTSGAMTIIVIMDSDTAGEEARKQIDKKCSKTYNIKHIRLSKNDIADMSAEEINKEIKAYLL
jgi:5S rRNA maturation endonuclease (ribonuclease M5)